MGHELLPRPLTPQEFDSMMREFHDAQMWMIEQLRRRANAVQESACDSADLGGGMLGGEARTPRLQGSRLD